MPMFSKGIVLAQHKEPAFSKPALRFVNPQTDTIRLDVKGIAVQTKEEAIIEIAKLAQIVDERDGRLLHRKLMRAQGRAKIVIADAVDDEPFVSSRVGPLLQLTDEVADGLELCCDVAGCADRLIMVYKNVTDLQTRIPRSLKKIKVMRVRGGYPADQTRRLRRLGDMPRLIVGVGALIHLARAVYEHKKQSTVFVTVAGNCVSNPVNLEVSIGMRVSQVLDRCGLHAEPTRVVCGGSMTGISIMDAENTLVTFTTKAILASRENERDAHYTCIGCGRCEQACPAGLNPMYIHRFVQNSYYANLRPFDAQLCIGCGTCSYVCPSKLDVAPAVAVAREYALRSFAAPADPDADDAEQMETPGERKARRTAEKQAKAAAAKERRQEKSARRAADKAAAKAGREAEAARREAETEAKKATVEALRQAAEQAKAKEAQKAADAKAPTEAAPPVQTEEGAAPETLAQTEERGETGEPAPDADAAPVQPPDAGAAPLDIRGLMKELERVNAAEEAAEDKPAEDAAPTEPDKAGGEPEPDADAVPVQTARSQVDIALAELEQSLERAMASKPKPKPRPKRTPRPGPEANTAAGEEKQ